MPDYSNHGRYAHISARMTAAYRSKVCNIDRMDFALRHMILRRSDYLESVPYADAQGPVPALPWYTDTVIGLNGGNGLQGTEDGLAELLDFIGYSPYTPILTATVFICGVNGRVTDDIGMFTALLQALGYCPAGLGFLEKVLRSEQAMLGGLIESAVSDEDYTNILEFMIDRMETAYAEALGALSVKDLTPGLDRDSREILLNARGSGEWFTVREAVTWARGSGEQTVRARLSQLVHEGVLEKEGNTRSTRFRFADPFGRGSVSERTNINTHDKLQGTKGGS